jgi:hypothetical protein
MVGPYSKEPFKGNPATLARIEKCFGMGMMASDAFEWILTVQRSDLPVDVVEGGYVTTIGFMLDGRWFDDLTQEQTDEHMELVRQAIARRVEQLTRDFYRIFGRTYIRWSDRQWGEEDPL